MTWSRGNLSARVEGETVRVSVSAQVRAVGDGPVEIPLLPARRCSPTPASAATGRRCCGSRARMWP
ncbi:MAG: hypothetical protein R3F43_00480 [bacterium]